MDDDNVDNNNASDFEQLVSDSLPAILVGAVAGGVLGLCKSLFFGSGNSSKSNWTRRLSFHPEAFDIDPECAELFLKLQKYRAISPTNFDEAGLVTDSLLCLQKQVARGEVP